MGIYYYTGIQSGLISKVGKIVMDDIPEDLLKHVIVIQAIWKAQKEEMVVLENSLIALLKKYDIDAPLDQVIDMLEGFSYGTKD